MDNQLRTSRIYHLVLLPIIYCAIVAMVSIPQVSAGINMVNGNNFEQASDIVFPSPFEDGFTFKRYYNSQSAVGSSIGYGWSHNFDVILYPDFNECTMLIRIKGVSGRGYYFEDYDEDGVFDGYFTENSSIEKDAQDDYIWTRDDGSVYKFANTTGLLLSITDKNGNIQSFTYNTADLLETVTDQASGRVLTFTYNADNKIASITGPVTTAVPDGIWATFSYDASGNLHIVQYADDENGSVASGFEYLYEDANDTHNLTSKKDLSGTVLRAWTYDTDDRAISQTKNQGVSSVIDYTDPDQVAVTDSYGITSVHTIQEIKGNKKVVQHSRSNGCSTCSSGIYQIDYDPDTVNPTRVERFNGREDLFQNYDANDNPQTIIKASGASEEVTLTKTYHPNMPVPLSITWKSLLADVSNADRTKVTIYDYDDPNAASDTATPNENPTYLLYAIIQQGFTKDASESVVAYEYTTHFTYTPEGQILTVDGPRPGTDDTLVFGYDSVTKDLTTITQPVTGTTTLGYDNAGFVISSTDPNNVVTTFTRDGRGRLMTVAAGGVTSTLTYNSSGELDQSTDSTGITTARTYNTNGLLHKIIASNGDYLELAYDANGNPVDESIYSSQGTKAFFAGRDFGDPSATPDLAPGQPWKDLSRNQDDTANLETVYTYTNSNIASVTDPESRVSEWTYDLFDRLDQEIIIKSDASQVITDYDYDNHGNLIRVTDANSLATAYTYDDMDRLIQTVSPDTGTTRYTYDESGNLKTKNQNSRAAEYLYDDQSRLTDIIYPNDSARNVTLSYDQGTYGKGRLTGSADPSGTAAYTYNLFGQLITDQKTIGGITYTTAYQYDTEGRLKSITYPSGRVVAYTLDSTGRPTRVDMSKGGLELAVARTITYEPLGPVKSIDYANHKTMESQSDLSFLPLTLTLSPEFDWEYFRDDVGNILNITDHADANQNKSFTYNDLYQLESSATPFGDIDWTYDNTGNRLTRTEGTLVDTYSYSTGTNLLAGITGSSPISITTNAYGNIETKGTKTFFYNLDNRLIRVEDNSVVIGEYEYNYYGQRIEKTAGSVTTLYHYDLSGNLIAETDTLGNTLKEYIYLGATPLAMIVYGPSEYLSSDLDQDGDVDGRDLYLAGASNLAVVAADFGLIYAPGEKMCFYHTDHLGTPIMMTDIQEQTIWRADYAPFGNLNLSVSQVGNNLRFPGQYFDEETGLHYNWHRYYDPEIGRYLTPDPIGLEGGINPFVYVLNNPIDLVDPLGLLTQFQRQIIIQNWTMTGTVAGAMLGFLGGGGAGFLTGPGAIAAAPAGAVAGATEGAALGTAAGLAIGTLVANMMDTGGDEFESSCDQKASEKTARDMAKQIERDLGKNARRLFHDIKEGGDRSLLQLKQDVQMVYEQYGKTPPNWMRP